MTSISGMLAATAVADHGHDFLFVHDVMVPHVGEWTLMSSAAAIPATDEAELEWGATVGVTERLGVMAMLHYADVDGAGWSWAAASAGLHVNLTPPGAAVLWGIHLGRGIALDSVVHHHDELDPLDPEPMHDAHEHRGIHQHGIDAWHARLVAETRFGATRLVANLLGLLQDRGSAELGYALGLRQPLTRTLALGVELLGDLDSSDYHETALGAYLSPSDDVTLKLGLGAGLSATSPDFTLHAGAVWRF